MDCARNIITANFSGGGTSATTAPLWQWDYGQMLCITGIEDLPAAFEVHFSTNKTGGVSTTVVGADGQVTIPSVLLTIGKNLNAWIYLSDAQGEGETEYSILIPVKARPMPETYDAEVSGEFDDVVRQVSEYAETAQTAADNAGASATAAAASADSAAASASAAETAKTAAETAQGKAEDAQAAAETAAQTATEKAQQTAQDAAQAAQSKADAESAAGRAEAAQTGAESAKTDAETAAQDAADSASAASASATSAGQAASAADQSATAAAQSATTAQGAAQTATTKAGEASASASAAAASETAAQTAQTGAETAETNAGQSASTATAKAAEAAQSASSAAQSKTDAEAAATRAETAAASLTVDSALSDSSVNPVQNKVVTGAITDVKSEINEVVTFSPNLLDKENITRGKYLTSNNVEITDANAFISNYFPCKPNEYFITKYSPYLGYGFITVYDQNKQYIASINGWGDRSYSCYQAGSASNIAFARICHQINMLDDLMIVSGQEYPAVYSDYDENKILVKALPDKLWLKVSADDIADAVFMNLFDKATAVDGEYVESTTGAFSYDSIYWRSGFIPVKPNTVYRASANNRVAFYDANKVYIEGYNSQYMYTSPTNAAYIVVCNTPLDSKSTFVLAESANYTGVYYKYGVRIPWLIEDAPKSKYAGKNLVCFGDSITNYGYTDTINTDTGINAVNVGLSSGRYAYSDDSDQYINAFAFHNIIYAISTGDWTIPDTLNGVSRYETQYAHIQDIKNIDFDNVDFASIAYGTNDFSSATPLDNESNPLDTNTFKGAIRYCLKLLTEKYPHLKIVGVTPCYRFWSENGVILYDSDEHAINGMYLKQYVEAVHDVFTEYHLPVLDNYNNAGINKYNCLQYFSVSDGLHPNVNGRAIIGHRIGDKILSEY